MSLSVNRMLRILVPTRHESKEAGGNCTDMVQKWKIAFQQSTVLSHKLVNIATVWVT